MKCPNCHSEAVDFLDDGWARCGGRCQRTFYAPHYDPKTAPAEAERAPTGRASQLPLFVKAP